MITCPNCGQILDLHSLADSLNENTSWHEGCMGFGKITITFGGGKPAKIYIDKIE